MALKNLKEPPFYIDLVGISPDPVGHRGIFHVTPTKTIDEVDKTDLVVVSAISGNRKELIWNMHL